MIALADCPDVRVRFLDDPGLGLWFWELVDPVSGEAVDSSWTGAWTGYGSAVEALIAGVARVAELRRSGRRAPGRRESHRSRRQLIVVAHEQTTLYRLFVQAFAGNPQIEVMQDRRFSERRRHAVAPQLERRRGDRRRRAGLDAEARSRDRSFVRAIEVAA